MCPGGVRREAAVNMLTTIFLSVLLMPGGLSGATASDLRVYGKSMHGDGRHTVRTQPHQQTKSEIRRSFDLKSFSEYVTPTTTSKSRLPTIVRLYPPTANPLHVKINMPMRFGREDDPGDDKSPNMTPNLPQRFGRFWEGIGTCPECPDDREAPSPVLPQRFGRNIPYWSLLRTVANAQLLNTALYWDLTTSSGEDARKQTFKG